jgi:hypothetical protein
MCRVESQASKAGNKGRLVEQKVARMLARSGFMRGLPACNHLPTQPMLLHRRRHCPAATPASCLVASHCTRATRHGESRRSGVQRLGRGVSFDK